PPIQASPDCGRTFTAVHLVVIEYEIDGHQQPGNTELPLSVPPTQRSASGHRCGGAPRPDRLGRPAGLLPAVTAPSGTGIKAMRVPRNSGRRFGVFTHGPAFRDAVQ